MNPGKIKLNHIQRRKLVWIALGVILAGHLVVTVLANKPVYLEPWNVWLKQVALRVAIVAAGCVAR